MCYNNMLVWFSMRYHYVAVPATEGVHIGRHTRIIVATTPRIPIDVVGGGGADAGGKLPPHNYLSINSNLSSFFLLRSYSYRRRVTGYRTSYRRIFGCCNGYRQSGSNCYRKE